VIEGLRRGESSGTITEHAISDIGHAIAHPFLGPMTQFAWTTAFGTDSMGRHIAETASKATTPAGIRKAAIEGKPEPGTNQYGLNLKAALEHINQPYSVLFGHERKNDTSGSVGETISKLTQAVRCVKYREPKKVPQEAVGAGESDYARTLRGRFRLAFSSSSQSRISMTAGPPGFRLPLNHWLYRVLRQIKLGRKFGSRPKLEIHQFLNVF